ncbi:uncharacterized protein LOC103508624 [Diaphorina citri]|uniref:Uncharacterized protein LOC103508624 n=1 Tax=Diaphorina citri TaxID=121845 RepID=A0A1S3D0A5_DIACI|nr:uncharacterized protein LOC103508624 [Diaphorina citri]
MESDGVEQGVAGAESGSQDKEATQGKAQKTRKRGKYEFPTKMKRLLACNRNMRKYVKLRRVEGLKSKHKEILKRLTGIKHKIDVEEYLRKTLKKLNLKGFDDDENESEDNLNELDDVEEDTRSTKDEDAESFNSDLFLENKKAPERIHFKKLKAKMKRYLKVGFYYAVDIKYVVPRCSAEQYLPIHIRNLKNALRKFEKTKPTMMYILAGYQRPGILPKLTLPDDAISNKDIKIKADRDKTRKRMRFKVRSSRRRRQRPKKYKKLQLGDLCPEVKEWKRNVHEFNKMMHRKKCFRKRPERPRMLKGNRIPLGKKGPDFGYVADHRPELYNYADSDISCHSHEDSPESDEDSVVPISFKDIADRKPICAESVDDEEVIEEDPIEPVEEYRKKSTRRKVRPNALLQEIFNECLQQFEAQLRAKPDASGSQGVVVSVTQQPKPRESLGDVDLF